MYTFIHNIYEGVVESIHDSIDLLSWLMRAFTQASHVLKSEIKLKNMITNKNMLIPAKTSA